MRAAAAFLLGLGLIAVPATAQEVQLTAPRPGTAPPLQIWASYEAAGWTLRVGDARGQERQRFVVQSAVSEAMPWVADADGDGSGDLWVPVMTGTANTAWQLWTMDPRRGQFRASGEIAGLDFARDPGGWLVAAGRNGCCAVSQVFYGFDRGTGAAREAFTIERTLRPDGRTQGCSGSRGAPQAVVRPWCNAAAEGWPPGVTALR